MHGASRSMSWLSRVARSSTRERTGLVLFEAPASSLGSGLAPRSEQLGYVVSNSGYNFSAGGIDTNFYSTYVPTLQAVADYGSRKPAL